ncbi:MAG: MBL fold metallo-hydrolase [Gammaproteobacteria bacterium]
MFGFDTIGNATLIVYDRKPILATDPWICGEAYFGSWDLPYAIPPDQLDAIHKCDYIWFSHGHPDHLNPDSLDKLSQKKILLPDHVGGWIKSGMQEAGLNVQVLPQKEWVQLSPQVKVMCLADFNQDATLLVAMGEHLIVDINDGKALGYKQFIRQISKVFKQRYLLALRNYGDGDMLNLWDDKGNYLFPPASKKPSVGKMYTVLAKKYNGTHIVPFSSFHRYQRKDSVWASKYSTPLAAHSEGFDYPQAVLLPAFIRINFEKGSFEELHPALRSWVVKDPAEFGDDWSDSLEADEFVLCEKYFKRKEHIANKLGFINLTVGKKDNKIVLNPKIKKGITFECPRHSLMTAIKHEIFDDLLLGNFMKVTLHNVKGLYPDFTPYVAKYADNGRAQTEAELNAYFKTYWERSTAAEFVLAMLHFKSEGIFRRVFSNQSELFQMSKKIYHRIAD